MNKVCERFDPISSACAPTCYVCSYHGRCEREKEKAVDSVRSTANGKEEKRNNRHFSDQYFNTIERGNQV